MIAMPLPDGTRDVIASADGWLLYKVSSKIELVAPTTTLLKCHPGAEREVATVADPLSDTVCGELGAVVVMVSVPAGCAPSAVGLRVRNILQLAPAASVGFKHVEAGVIAYGVPVVTLRELMRMEDVPVFFRLTALALLVVFTTTLPKFTDVVVTVVCAVAKTVKIRQKIAVSDTRTTLFSFRMTFPPRFDMTKSSLLAV